MADDASNASLNTDQTSGDEILLRVPEALALVPIGYAFDAGGSVTKLIYRSKKDYSNGKRIKNDEPGQGILRLRYFESRKYEEFISFLRDNCDIMDSARKTHTWFQTGVHTQQFKDRLEEVLDTKIRALSEPDATSKGLIRFYSQLPELRPLETSPRAVGVALTNCRDIIRMMEGAEKIGDTMFDEVKSKVDMKVMAECTAKIMTADEVTLAKELSVCQIEWPCAVCVCGSSHSVSIYRIDGRHELGSYSGISGKTFLGLGKLLCGAKDFDDLLEMASRGDHRKVDTLAGDMMVKDRQERDWYSEMPENVVTFSLGKLAEDSYDGTYTKDDLAAGLLHLFCFNIVRIAFQCARLLKMKQVLFTGSLVSRQVVRETVEQYFLQDSLFMLILREEQIKCLFVPHSGFISASGIWCRNLEIEQEDKQQNHI